jgi:hypothetical protein
MRDLLPIVTAVASTGLVLWLLHYVVPAMLP